MLKKNRLDDQRSVANTHVNDQGEEMFGDYDSENDCHTKTMEAGAFDNKRMR